MLAADAAIFVLSLFLAYLLRFDFTPSPDYLLQMVYLYIYVLPIKVVVFFVFGIYRGMWRYTDLFDFWRILQASLISSLLLVALVLYLHRFEGYPRSVFFIDGLLTLLLCSMLRVFIRTMYRYRENLHITVLPWKRRRKIGDWHEDVIIIGAGDAGEKLLREIIENPSLNYDVVGFLDDNQDKKGRSVHGVPVLGQIHDLEVLGAKMDISQVLIAMPQASGEQMRRIITICDKLKISYKTLPSLGEIVNGKVGVKDLRYVDYGDLLGREQVRLDLVSIQNYLQGQVVLISGAGGSIGSELTRQIVKFSPAKIVILDVSELNLHNIQNELDLELAFHDYIPVLGQVQDKSLLEWIFEEHCPSVVFHAAAYKHVPILEDNPWQAVFNNIHGSQVIMETALKYNAAKFVLVSTDKAVRPTNVMGASKRIVELMMYEYNYKSNTAFMAVRFGNVLGSSGSVVPLFKRQIEHGGPVTVTHSEMTRYFMSISEAAQLIVQAGALGKGGEIFILDMGVPVKIDDMARDLILLMGKKPDMDVKIEYIGIRPGEKLHEELAHDLESLTATRHEKILVLKNEIGQGRNRGAISDIQQGLIELLTLAEKRDLQGIKSNLKELVPEYNFGTTDMSSK